MAKQWITVKEVALNNNCPECFSKDGLGLTYKQEFIDTKFSKSITQNISTEMHCSTCNTIIYPERWTEDIERIYEYQMKAFTPKKVSKKFKPLFWVIIGITLALLITAIALLILL
ncbi:hypothetical protein [uncultured Lacinutrix sp.]|uniref:hypothetical protein n=1 Tax=uncultured Lacinutrix sp. TaxID=574032 RepID=UPI002632E134|nr:hypothetical protein [uncultured Lacinutrix sp.]